MEIEKIYSLYFTDIYKFLLSMTKNIETAQDITSITFLKLVNNPDKFKDVDNLKSYLFTIARNSYFDYYKQNKMTITTDDMDKFDQAVATFENELIKNEEINEVSRAIEKLDEPYKSVTKLRMNEMSFKQIGQIYSKTDNWACVTFYRAKEKLKQILEDDYGM